MTMVDPRVASLGSRSSEYIRVDAEVRGRLMEIYTEHNFQGAWRKTHTGVPKDAPPYVLGAKISFFGEDNSPPAGGTLHPNINARRGG